MLGKYSNKMQAFDYVSGLHNSLEFCETHSCL